ncbi:MAG TPA: SPFH domain-containing protein [Thermomicrobiaceae bacterium]|nr:SPFH domain-containing protein [Thermomicrobiaceae bacterium]
MAGFRNVISTLSADGQEILGPNILLWHYPGNDIMNGSLLTVESNHFCVLKSRGAILNVYDTGQYPVETPQKVLFGSLQQAFYGGTSPWQYEALYVNRAKLVLKASGVALSRELAVMNYGVDYYIHVATKEDATLLVQHMPYRGHALTTDDVNAYAGPVVEQAINQVVQVTPLESVNEKIHELTQIVHEHLQEFLSVYGITLDMVKVLVFPGDERMRELISLKAFGLSELDAVRYYTAMLMAQRGVVSAPNMAVGEAFNIGNALPQVSVPMGATVATPATPAVQPSNGDGKPWGSQSAGS